MARRVPYRTESEDRRARARPGGDPRAAGPRRAAVLGRETVTGCDRTPGRCSATVKGSVNRRARAWPPSAGSLHGGPWPTESDRTRPTRARSAVDSEGSTVHWQSHSHRLCSIVCIIIYLYLLNQEKYETHTKFNSLRGLPQMF
eukprot:626627-Hanusia_phi.AAC.2